MLCAAVAWLADWCIWCLGWQAALLCWWETLCALRKAGAVTTGAPAGTAEIKGAVLVCDGLATLGSVHNVEVL